MISILEYILSYPVVKRWYYDKSVKKYEKNKYSRNGWISNYVNNSTKVAG